MSSCELNLGDQGMYVYEDSDFSEVSVFRTFTFLPINGLNIKFYASHFRFRISTCVMVGYDLVYNIAI